MQSNKWPSQLLALLGNAGSLVVVLRQSGLDSLANGIEAQKAWCRFLQGDTMDAVPPASQCSPEC